MLKQHLLKTGMSSSRNVKVRYRNGMKGRYGKVIASRTITNRPTKERVHFLKIVWLVRSLSPQFDQMTTYWRECSISMSNYFNLFDPCPKFILLLNRRMVSVSKVRHRFDLKIKNWPHASLTWIKRCLSLRSFRRRRDRIQLWEKFSFYYTAFHMRSRIWNLLLNKFEYLVWRGKRWTKEHETGLSLPVSCGKCGQRNSISNA